MPPVIRPAHPADGAAVVELWQECGLIVSHNDPRADFTFALTGVASCVLVAEDRERRLVGSVMVGHDGHRGWLYYLAVASGCRGRGFGRALVTAAEDWLRECHVPKVQLLVRDTNVAVVGFYEGLGFATAQSVVMGKWLRSPGREE